mmetsp:Transcript_5923/g.15006  ORF Transcript_5923/g.15006 Transcript_5923/m.15006 type:complete len:259 (-) Transcript_5923:72-848(-)
MWAAVLLYSATRSSYVAVCQSDDVDKQPGVLDASDADGPLAVAAPWRIACVAERPTKEGADAVAAAVAKCGGFRARFRACDALRLAAPSRDAPPAAAVAAALSSIDLGLHGECGSADALDGMTYAWVDVRHPDKDQFVRVRTLVDTGSTDCELKADVIRKLGLPATGETAHFETAVGRVTEQPIYEAVIRVLGREARVVLSPADGDESDDESDASDEELDARFGFDRVSDEGILGHTALAALNLAVDCRKRRLVALPE